MIVNVERGVVGQNEGLHWGTTAEGDPVLAIVAAGAVVRIVMTPAEAKEFGATACYMAMSTALAARAKAAPNAAAAPSDEASPRPASSLVGPNGLPLS